MVVLTFCTATGGACTRILNRFREIIRYRPGPLRIYRFVDSWSLIIKVRSSHDVAAVNIGISLQFGDWAALPENLKIEGGLRGVMKHVFMAVC